MRPDACYAQGLKSLLIAIVEDTLYAFLEAPKYQTSMPTSVTCKERHFYANIEIPTCAQVDTNVQRIEELTGVLIILARCSIRKMCLHFIYTILARRAVSWQSPCNILCDGFLSLSPHNLLGISWWRGRPVLVEISSSSASLIFSTEKVKGEM
jgi:hypothetical protein